MKNIIKCDLAIIGAGSGGLSLASGAVQLGLNVVLIEHHKMGGDCLNYGCVPSKSLIAAANSARDIKNAKLFGIDVDKVTVHFNEVMNHVHDVIDSIKPHDSIERFEKLGVHVLKEKARFLNQNEIEAGNNLVQAKYFVIATGTSPRIPTIKGLNSVGYETNETIFNLKESPDHLIVVGGGPIGCELSQAFASLGVKTSLIVRSSILPNDDPECVAVVRDALKNDGVDLYENVKVKLIENALGKVQVSIEGSEKTNFLTGSHLLVATGRKPNLDDLGLDNAEIKYSNRGIQTDDRLRTSQRHIYAIGDIAGLHKFTHTASHHASIVLKHILFWIPSKVEKQVMPWVTYTDPELAHVGEPTQHENDGRTITSFELSDNDRARTEKYSRGKIKVVTDSKGRVKGVTIVGPHAGELITPWTMSIKDHKKLSYFSDIIIPYPTLSELSKAVSGEFYKPKLFSPMVKKVVSILLKLGRRT